jgi:exosortase
MLMGKEFAPRFLGREPFLRSWPTVLFSLMVTISVVIWWGALKSLFALAWRDDQYTHILLILPISAALIFVDEEPGPDSGRESGGTESFLQAPQRSLGVSAALGCGALMIIAFVNSLVQRTTHLTLDAQLTANILALVSCWIVLFAFCFGLRTFRRALFALCFLFAMVPLPTFALNSVVSFLQHGSAAAAYWLFAISGIPVAQRNLLLHIPGLTLAVAPECSSIRSSLFLLITSAVLAHLLLRSPWKKVLLVAAAIPLSIAKNGLRIFVLGVLATRVDPGFLRGRLHRQGGILYFLIALAAIIFLLWVLRGDAENSKLNAGSRL